jgi:hypothetical protein
MTVRGKDKKIILPLLGTFSLAQRDLNILLHMFSVRQKRTIIKFLIFFSPEIFMSREKTTFVLCIYFVSCLVLVF